MQNVLPSIPLKDFDEQLFTEIIRIYARSAGINDPVGKKICPRKEIPYLLKNLSEGKICDFTFGSLVHHLSKLRISPTKNHGGTYVQFDFFLRAHPALKPTGPELRDDFLKKVEVYLSLR